ncbi:GlsB/YeaQ/YmgE family stress response membrane protein [Bdellovibrio bacteriovorus]|uniref:GlsB/YeaQ/YmgE family stress response membrane protein n=1 Tax=Bdellovibrio bacteriovorus TaxID=959 RepID=UPI0035A68C7A
MTYVNMVLNHPWFNQFVLWSLLGLGVGVVAKIIIPGSENMGWIRTILLGLAGSFIGNFLTPPGVSLAQVQRLQLGGHCHRYWWRGDSGSGEPGGHKILERTQKRAP